MSSGCQVSVKSFCFNPFRENSYLLWNEEGECVIVDPGCYDDYELRAVRECISSKGLNPKAVWLTHGHFDHIFGVAALSREFGIPVGLAAPDVSFETTDLEDGQQLGFAGFKVITTPGHTPGGVCFFSEECRILLCGDTLFAGAIGRTDLVGGDYDKEIVGIMEKLMVLPGDVDVLPGHGPASCIAEERTSNPFLQPFNEPWENEELD